MDCTRRCILTVYWRDVLVTIVLDQDAVCSLVVEPCEVLEIPIF